MTMKIKPLLQRKVIYSVILIGLLAIALLNFLSWLFLRSLKSDITAELQNQIKHLGNVTTRLINGNDLEKMVPGMESSPLVIYYQQLLYEIKLQNNLENILILDPTGKLLVDYRLNFQIGDSVLTFPLEPRLLREAALGRVPTPSILHVQNQYFLSGYFPILDDLDQPAGILVVDAPAAFFTTLQKFERGSLYLGAGGLLVLLVFSVIIIWASRRLLQIELRMQERERLAQLGQMAATVAHEIRNPLSIIKGAADVLARQLGPESGEMLPFISEEIDRLNRMVENFLRFARRPQLNRQPENIGHFLQEVLSPLQDERLRLEVEEGVPPVKIDRDAFQQVLLNLIKNAREAAETGEIFIRVSARHARVVVEISDRGPGIPPNILKQVFEPFFSTKASGSGLGLAISKQLVEAMGGKIEIHSRVHHGTTVRIILPK